MFGGSVAVGKVIKKALPILATVAGIALAIPSGGTSLLAAGLGVSGTVAGAITAGLSLSASLLSTTSMPKIPQSETQLSRLQARLDTQAPRKIVLGPDTAFPADIRYYEGSGEDERVIEYIIAVAAHKVREISELWIEDELAWSETGGIAPQFVDYLGVEGYKEGRADNTRAINGGARWGSDDRLTGCAYLYVRVNRLGATENEQSPFANGLPGRVTIVGEGMPMYDPRFDSTRGGSGSMRVDNQNTWGPSSGNPIIQSLNVLLGWRINGKLSVGAGIPAKYINFDSVITAANACDEDIVLSGGGTQPRYRTAGAFSTDDAPMNIVGALLAGCAGDLLDSDGQLSFLIKTNTLAVPAVTFDDHDILSAGRWDPMGGQTNLPNIISGNFTDPSDRSLYQPVPYPSVRLDSEDGIERTAPVDLPVVENAPQAERLAKQTLQRMQYPGLFSAEYNMKGMAAKVGSIVWQSYSPRGWLNKPFRVVSQKPSRSGRIALVLREEHEDIYAWEAEDSAAVQPAEPVGFDFRNTGPILLAREAAKVAEWPRVIDSDGTKPEDNATFGSPDGSPVGDRNAEDVTGAIDDSVVALANLAATNAEISAEVDQHAADIAGLIDTYGVTASAEESADIAEQARIAAEAAKQGAIDQAGLVAQDKLTVETYRGQALQYRDAALVAKEAAEGAQAAATTQAGLSATARNQSEAFAAVSQGASVQSNQAASAAAASADVSARFSQTITSAPAMEAKYFRQTTGGAPETGNDTSIEFFDGADGRHARLYALNDTLISRHVLSAQAGTIVEAVARLEFAGSGSSVARLVVYWLDKDYGVVSSTAGSDVNLDRDPTPYTFRATRPNNTSIAFARVVVQNRGGDQAVVVYELYGRNVTALAQSETQAAISQASAAIATAEAAAAQTSSVVSARYATSANQPVAVVRESLVDSWSGDPRTLADTVRFIGEDATYGRWLSLFGDGQYVQTRAALPVRPGGKVQGTAILETIGGQTPATMTIAWLDDNYNVLSYSFLATGIILPYDPANFQFDQVVPSDPKIRYGRLGVRRDAGGAGTVGVYGLKLIDKAAAAAAEASITEMRGAAADSSGNRAAFLKLVAAASGGNPAMFELLASASGSKIGLVSDVIALGNSINGIVETVLKVENGQAVLSDAIIRRLRVAPRLGSAILHDVALRPREYLASDGNVVQYEGGASYGAVPEKIVPNLSGLPALAAGESYDVRAVSVSATQFTARAKKLSPGPMTERSGTTQVISASTPNRRINKPVSADAYNGDYEFKWTANLAKIDEFNQGGNTYVATYQGSFDLYINNGSNWIKVGSHTANASLISNSGPNPSTTSVTSTKVINSDISAPSGSQIFGLHPTTNSPGISQFTSVKFTTQTGTTATAVSGLIRWEVYPPRD